MFRNLKVWVKGGGVHVICGDIYTKVAQSSKYGLDFLAQSLA